MGALLARLVTWAIVTVRDRKRLLADLSEVWEVSGKEVLERLAKDDPAKLVKIAFGLLPRDVFISVEQKTPGNLEAEAWATLRRVLDLIEACKIEGDPWAVFAAIEETYAQEWLYCLNRLNRGSDDEGHAANNRDGDERSCG